MPHTLRTPRGRWIGIVSLVAAVVLVGVGVYRWQFATYHLATVKEGVLYRDGNRDVHQFLTAVRRSNARTVISLVDDNEIADAGKPQFQAEVSQLSKEGVKLVRIPVTLGGWPTTQDIARFFAVVSDRSSQPVLVHCAQGVRRTGMFVAAYQESVMGYDSQKAKASILTFGHSARTQEDVKRFIDIYNPQTRAVAATLPSTGVE